MVSVDGRSRYAIGGFLKNTLGKKVRKLWSINWITSKPYHFSQPYINIDKGYIQVNFCTS